MTRSRAAGVVVAVVALALTAWGLVIAATDTTPVSHGADPLALNGYPPRSTQIHVVISARQGLTITGDLNVNFKTNAMEGTFHIPVAVTDLTLAVRVVGKQVYLGSANMAAVTGAKWVSLPISAAPSLYGLSLEMTKPDIALISGYSSKSVSHSGYETTYVFHGLNQVLNAAGALSNLVPRQGNVTLSVTTGRQGELTAGQLSITSAHSHSSLSMTVLSYNQPATIVAPPASQVKPLGAGGLQNLFGSTPFGTLLGPGSISSLGQLQLN